MLKHLEEEMQACIERNNELVQEYNEKVKQRDQLNEELVLIEKQVLHNQGAMDMITRLAGPLVETQEDKAVEADPTTEESTEKNAAE